MKKTKLAILVLVLATACEFGADGCSVGMQPEVQDAVPKEQVTTQERAPTR